MSRLISDILNAPEPRFNHTLHAWEQMSGHSGHDIRLISDIVQKRKKTLASLDLDETDTTPRELFHALCQRAVVTNQAVIDELNISETDTPEQLIDTIVSFIDKLTIKREVWTIKHSAIKQMLKNQPPKKLLKILGLRSIDSVLKRTSAYELLALAYQIENEDWTAKMQAQYKKLKPVDFQASTSTIYIVDRTRVKKLHSGGYKSSRIVVPNYETGTILVVPPAERFNLDALAITMAVLQTLYDLRLYSAYFRLISVKPKFGSKLHNVLLNGLPGNVQNMEIGWTVLQRHFTDSPESFTAIEQPHIQHEDIELISPLEALSEVLPDLHFWNENGHVFIADGSRPVSLHMMDVVTNVSNKLPYEKSIHIHLQQQLWEELGLRYIKHHTIRDAVIQRIEDDSVGERKV